MKKIILVIAALTVGLNSAFAQLTTRENCATNECLGVRPEAGDMALTFALGLSTENADSTLPGGTDKPAFLDIRNSLSSGDMLTFKYYKTSTTAYRIGLRLYRDSYKFKGESDSALQALTGQIISGTNSTDELTLKEYKDSRRQYILAPGIEKHYSNSNFFDVYAGADLYLGFSRDVKNDVEEYQNGATFSHKQVTTGAVVGLGAIVGFNVWIAHLPISLGLEYGWNLKKTLGGKTKHEQEVNVPGATATNFSETYYTSDNSNTGGGAYSKINQREVGFDTNQNVRIALNIYFSKQKNSDSK